MNILKTKKVFNSKIQSGFSLIELILAIAIFSLGSFAMATMLIDSNLSTKLSSERIDALFYAKEGIEAVRLIRNNSWTTWSALTDGDYSLATNASSTWSLGTTSAEVIDSKYTRTVNIVTSSSSDLIKEVTVSVAWDLNPAREVSVSLNTFLTDWPSIVNSDSQITTDGLVAYWSFDDAPDGTALDSIGDNDGTVTGATATSGVKSFGYSFDGDGDYISELNSVSSTLGGASSASISIWVKRSGIGTRDVLVDLSIGNVELSKLFCEFQSNNTLRLGGRAELADVFQSKTTTATFIDTSLWYHVVGIIDIANDNILIYVNGVLQSMSGAPSWTATAFNAGVGAESTLGIGSSLVNDFIGIFDQVRIYNRALTAEEIATIYEEESP